MKRAREAYEPLRELEAFATRLGAPVKSHAGMVGIDLISPKEAYDVMQAHKEITQSGLETAMEVVKRSHLATLSDNLSLPIIEEVAVFEEGPNTIVLGVPLEGEAVDRVIEEREVLEGCLSALARTSVSLPEIDDEFYMTVGVCRTGKFDEDVLDDIAQEAARLLWEPQAQNSYVTASNVADVYDPNIRSARLLVPVSQA